MTNERPGLDDVFVEHYAIALPEPDAVDVPAVYGERASSRYGVPAHR